MHLALTVRDLVVLSWAVSPAAVGRDLPAELVPALDPEGRAIVSLVALRATDVRVSDRRAPGFRQLNLRTYVERAGTTEILLLSVRASLFGVPAALFGVPVRPARLHVREGRVSAPGLGVSFGYERRGPAGHVPAIGGAAIGSQPSLLAFSAGVRRIDAPHDPFAWEDAALTAPPRVEPVLALGFDVAEPHSALYAARTAFHVELPPKALE